MKQTRKQVNLEMKHFGENIEDQKQQLTFFEEKDEDKHEIKLKEPEKVPSTSNQTVKNTRKVLNLKKVQLKPANLPKRIEHGYKITSFFSRK